MGFKTKKKRKSGHNSSQTKRTREKRVRAKGLGNNIFKNANVFWSDPFETKRKGRGSDLLDLVVNLDSSKNEWRQLKTNLAKLAAFDLNVPIEQKNHSDKIIHRLKKKGLNF